MPPPYAVKLPLMLVAVWAGYTQCGITSVRSKLRAAAVMDGSLHCLLSSSVSHSLHMPAIFSQSHLNPSLNALSLPLSNPSHSLSQFPLHPPLPFSLR